MPLRIGSRVFAPRWYATLVTALLLGLLLSLGRWQLHRAGEKRAMFDAFARGADTTLGVDAVEGSAPPGGGALQRYQHVEADGHYVAQEQFLIDNMIAADGRAGYFVITPFELDSGRWLLVNRGWIPVGQSREELPGVAVTAQPRHIRGRADNLPRPGIRLGASQTLAPPYPIRANFPSLADIRTALGAHRWNERAEVVLLDRDQPDGYVRQWAAPGFPPLRHLAYSVQWFALALALAVIYFVTNLRK